ncbi:MAG: glucoamylase family protein, partial [Clostridia bacterium]
MISEADFSFFYNEKKHLFNLGYDADKNESGNICYDMLMSEIRTACYFCAATGRVPKKLWQSLSRTLVAENGFVGMVSWSGTAFEYFMPELFLPKQSNSIIDESLQFAFYNQRKTRKNGVFGISESGFYSFDSEMNYQYKAHGVQEIALKKYPKTEFVVSPYSSFLMLGENVSACLKNLLKLKDMGAYGKYGFYEAIDMTDGESIVQSYMSHHIGMSILGAANICFDKIFQKRFMQEKQLFACRELLCECIPKRMHLFVDIGNAPQKSNPGKPIPPTKIVGEPSLADPSAAFIHGGSLTLEVSGSGHIFMKYGEYAINDISFLP